MTDSDSNLENAAVEGIVLKCNHTTIFGDFNYKIYPHRNEDFKKLIKIRPNTVFLKMVTLEYNELDTESALLKRLTNFHFTKLIKSYQFALFCTEAQ